MIEKIRLAKVTSELEKNVGLFDAIKSDKKLFDRICASFVYIDS